MSNSKTNPSRVKGSGSDPNTPCHEVCILCPKPITRLGDRQRVLVGAKRTKAWAHKDHKA